MGRDRALRGLTRGTEGRPALWEAEGQALQAPGEGLPGVGRAGGKTQGERSQVKEARGQVTGSCAH